MDELREAIEARYGSVYRFIKATGLPKGSVYQTLAGTYPGEAARERQVVRIRAALAGESREDRVFSAIKGIACGVCTAGHSGRCRSCDVLLRKYAKAALAALEG